VRRTLAGLLWLLLLGACRAEGPLPSVALELAGQSIQAEVAATDASRQHGLMGRTALAEQAGMLFVFPRDDRHCMWMENTLIPLAVAFLDAEGRILNSAEMTPRSRQIHCAGGPARYALEMNGGWFGRRNVPAGARLANLAGIPAAR
jgi:hypothetical protein